MDFRFILQGSGHIHSALNFFHRGNQVKCFTPFQISISNIVGCRSQYVYVNIYVYCIRNIYIYIHMHICIYVDSYAYMHMSIKFPKHGWFIPLSGTSLRRIRRQSLGVFRQGLMNPINLNLPISIYLSQSISIYLIVISL